MLEEEEDGEEKEGEKGGVSVLVEEERALSLLKEERGTGLNSGILYVKC